MTVTIDTETRVDANTLFYEWSSDLHDPTFYVYVDAKMVNTTKATSQEFHVEPDDFPAIEILDNPSTEPQYARSSRETLAWYAHSLAESYRIDELVSDVWTERATIFDAGEGFFVWVSRPLEDMTQHEFRVVPIGTDGNDGQTPARIFVPMIRLPDVPNVAYTYNGATPKTVTITEA